MSQRNRDRTNWLGVCLLVIGLIYLNKQYHWDFLGFHHWLPNYHIGWEVMLMGIGLLLLITGRSMGLFLMLLGLFFLLPYSFYDLMHQLQQWWPLVLIIAGLSILVRSRTVVKN